MEKTIYRFTMQWRKSCFSGNSHRLWNQDQRQHSGTHQQAWKRRSPHRLPPGFRLSLPQLLASQSWRWWNDSSSLFLAPRTSVCIRHWQPFQTPRSPMPKFLFFATRKQKFVYNIGMQITNIITRFEPEGKEMHITMSANFKFYSVALQKSSNFLADYGHRWEMEFYFEK